MADRKWTKQQQQAIDARGGSLLLSAAAGSGKTAVLVERIVKLLTEGAEPVEPSQLLVVTFTNAAAAEMRGRINEAVSSMIEKNPENTLYRNVKMKLPEAQISTIDSFCIKLVRENYHSTDIDPDFTLLDDSEQRILRAEAMTKTLDDMSSENPEAYDLLNSMTAYGRDDTILSDKIYRLYSFSLAHPFPDIWLEEIKNMYICDGDLKQSKWGKIIILNAVENLKYCEDLLTWADEDASSCEKIYELYSERIAYLKSETNQFASIVDTGSWDEIYEFANELSFLGLPAAPRGYGKDPAKLAAEIKYKKAVEIMKKLVETFCAAESENREDLEKLRPVIELIIDAVHDFGKNYMLLKSTRNSYGFTDIMHKALDLLAKPDGDGIQKTSLAYEMSQRYSEILIDEYQDTNEAQDMLFTLLSRNESNLFAVGDVKQSIYSFRLAMPEIFVKKCREYHEFDGTTYPAKITLGMNFRSRKGVLDSVNYLFENLMSEYAGDLEYTANEALYYGNTYPDDTEPAAELRFVNAGNVSEEADYVAKLIDDMLKSNVQVTNRDGTTRNAKKGDFCILLRSTKGKLDIYEKALYNRGISAGGDSRTSLFDAVEISVFMSLMKVIDNPTDDVAMLSILMSSLYGFTADDIAEIKIPDKNLNLYTCLVNATENIKAQKFLEDLVLYRRTASVMKLDMFMRTVLDETGFMAIVSAMKNGESRRTNLIMLCEIASGYIDGGGTGLGGFIRYINRSVENGAVINAASDVSQDADVVRIYSMHKSKGLEFPFVILADCGKKFNQQDLINDMIISSEAGVGMVMLNANRLQKFPTVCYTAAKLELKRSMMSEELRILYVAMTRAKEKIIMVSSATKLDDAVGKIAACLSPGGKPPACAVINAGSYMQWLLMGYMSHPDAAVLSTGFHEHDYKNAEGRLNVICDNITAEEVLGETAETPEADESIVEEIKNRVDYVYPYDIPVGARPKKVASDFEKKMFKPEYFAKSKPSFLSDGKLSAADAGTANHLFLQCCDFGARDASSERDRLLNENVLTSQQADAIRIDKMNKFFASPLCECIRNADEVLREKEFTVEVNLCDVEENVNDNVKNEKILILGKTDIVFIKGGEATIVDYKTDRSKNEDEFTEAYSGQLRMYRKAMEQILDVPIVKTVIYSLALEKEIVIE